jgi:uncharacterized protein YqgQ
MIWPYFLYAISEMFEEIGKLYFYNIINKKIFLPRIGLAN